MVEWESQQGPYQPYIIDYDEALASVATEQDHEEQKCEDPVSAEEARHTPAATTPAQADAPQPTAVRYKPSSRSALLAKAAALRDKSRHAE